MKPVHHLAHQAERPDGGVEWACPQCGHYRVDYSDTQVVVLQGAHDSVHVSGAGFPPPRDDLPGMSEFDHDFLRRHTNAW